MTAPRIFCIGRNYAEHIRELGHAADDACVVFMKPGSCIVAPEQTLALPRGRGAVHHEAELVLQLSGGGRNIAIADALQHVAALTLGLDLTLRDLQKQLKDKGAPWEISKAFDGAAPLGRWQPYRGQDLGHLTFECRVNGTLRQKGDTAEMLYPVARLIHILSQTWALLDGDIVYTGTPAGVGSLEPGDRIELQGPELGACAWTCA